MTAIDTLRAAMAAAQREHDDATIEWRSAEAQHCGTAPLGCYGQPPCSTCGRNHISVYLGDTAESVSALAALDYLHRTQRSLSAARHALAAAQRKIDGRAAAAQRKIDGRAAAAATRAKRAALRRTLTERDAWTIARRIGESYPSTATVRRALEAAGIHPSLADTADIGRRYRTISDRRKARRQQQEHRGQRGPVIPGITPSVLAPTLCGRILDRLAARRESAVQRAARRIIAAGRDSEYRIRLGGEPGYRISASTCHPYRGSWKTWAANEYTHTITVPTDWRLSVERRGLATVHDAITLAAVPVPAPGGIEAMDCLVARQGRGISVTTERRLYARLPGEAWQHVTPETLAPDASVIRRERNTERRRLMIAAYGGLDRYLTEIGARVVARDARGELLRVGSGESALTAVRVTCPTTGRVYVESVPPTMTTPSEAIAWQFGVPADQYRPSAES